MEVQKGNIITTDLKETERVRLTESVVGWVIQFYSNITGGVIHLHSMKKPNTN